jgi:hypothetical protein
LFGKTKQGKQRFRCLVCNKTFIWKRPYNKIYKEQHWFKVWITEGYAIRQLVKISGHSRSKLDRIRNYWLSKEPNIINLELIKNSKYLLFDGTYFHKDNCLIVVMDYKTQKIIKYKYVLKENYLDTYKMLCSLKDLGLNPKIVTLDGHKQVMQAFVDVWPNIIIQRCLFHIQRQGLQWLRVNPKTEAGINLRIIIKKLTNVKTQQDEKIAIQSYESWHNEYKNFIKKLPRNSAANIDLKKATSLINNALPNMYHFVKDQKIASTTNLLEGYFSKLKHKYRCHNGLSKQHKINYLKWYCYFKNSNTF